jgi:ankyrin repeat protein
MQTTSMTLSMGHPSCIGPIFLRLGADVNAIIPGEGTTALHDVAYFLRADIARVLLHAGATVDAVDLNDKTPLWVALQMVFLDEHCDMIHVLLDYGASFENVTLSALVPN